MRNGLPRILAVELGDSVELCCAVPAVHLLRETYPDAQLDVLTSPPAAELLQHHPCVDETLVLDSDHGLTGAHRMATAIKNRRYEIAFDFSGSKTSALITWRSNAGERFGFAAPRTTVGVRRAYTHGLRLGDEARNRTYQNLLLSGEACGHARPQEVSLPTSDEQVQLTDALFHERFEGDKRVVGLGFGLETGNRNVEFMHALCERIAADGRFDLILVPLPDAWDTAREIAGRFSRGDILPPRINGMGDVLAMILNCSITVTTTELVGHMSYLNGIKSIRVRRRRHDDALDAMEYTAKVIRRPEFMNCIDEIEQALVMEYYPVQA